MTLADMVAYMCMDRRHPAQLIAAHKATLDAIHALEQRIAALETASQDKTPAKQDRR